MTRWSNWAGTATASPLRVHRPRDTNGIAEAIGRTVADGRRLRPLGSGHSFTAIAAANSDAMDLTGWTGIASADVAKGLVTVRSGTTLKQLNAELDALGLAMTNLGDIDAQTVAGAISTGTHGTGARLGGIATQIAALELVLADGTVVTCSADERPELFAAARVGLGALGVISTVTLQCEPSFLLAAQERPEPLEQVLEGFDQFADENDHFEFYWFPYGKNALVKRNNRLPAGSARRPLSKLKEFVDYEITENVAFGGLCRLGRAVPRLVRPLGGFASNVLSAREYSDTSHRVFVTHRGVRFVESEFAVPRESLLDVFAELRALVPKLENPVAFPVEVRVAAADDIWLSTANGRDSAYIAIHQFVGMPYREYFAGFASIVGEVGGRPHWGKMHDLDAATLRSRYPRFDDFSRVRKEVDPAGVFANTYLDRVLGTV
ncbi:D-arabinono-1,4-lactone oxidase [Amycolatopsis regifaucium]|uniref:FAD-linked oxidoreductase n=1 Tax=Amycolatopsis regifaucium TaxID=546365 RepID=A0A154MQ64_9PSEU|nr:D-arabinono-1,4-lactone oxidase [Amycolatopsis regifaucium]KZB86416.1 FAD-linked oxidoreductase [Amycolatopsis regifaucium]OKA06393.1 FAD-linked oxidoreductase [Amycolatopsis regifaucium]SFJ29195.1 FAD-linked oxidoreductase [Amycolatopsis regifaucium]